MKARGNDDGRNYGIDKPANDSWRVTIDFNFVEERVNLTDRSSVPEVRIQPAEFLVRNFFRQPTFEMRAGDTFPDAKALMDVLPRAGSFRKSSVEIKDYRRNHLWLRTRFKNSFRVF